MSDIWMVYASGFAAFMSWIVAGIFWAFSDFVMRSLNRIKPEQAIVSMQSINKEVYFTGFMFALFALPLISLAFVAHALIFGTFAHPAALAGLIYIVMVMGVTAFGNVPMNEQLATVDPGTGSANDQWQAYSGRWTALNHLRTLGSILAAIGFTLAAFSAA